MWLYDCRCEHLQAPVGVDNLNPRFSWKIGSDKNNVKQKSYRILVSKESDFRELVWDSTQIFSDQSLWVEYNGKRLEQLQKYYWKVEVATTDEYAVSGIHIFEMGILNPDFWKGKWIEADEDIQADTMKPAVYFRKSFQVLPRLRRARIFQSAHGIYEFWINGKTGTDDLYKPGFTSYYHRIQYQTYDITNLLSAGENVWSVAVGDGWWRGVTGGAVANNFGYRAAYIGQIFLEYEDGTTEFVRTDANFRTSSGGWLETDMRRGEVYDANREPEGWKIKGFDDSMWKVAYDAREHNRTDSLIPSRSVPVRVRETFEGQILKDKKGDLVIDFGQNLAGRVRMILRGLQKGQIVRIEHAEDMKDGIFSYGNMAFVGTDSVGEFQRVEYIAKGNEEENFTPCFSIFGFRYIRVLGYDGVVKAGDFTAQAVYSDLDETGSFECSNPLVNKLARNCVWSQKSNYLDVPTDCPTRERSAWTGDSQVYCRTATRFMDVYPFMEKWLQDYIYEQFPNGLIPGTVPNTVSPHHPQELKKLNASVIRGSFESALPGHMYTDPEYGAEFCDGTAGWGDAAVINPFILYERYGDKKILQNQYPCAKAWVDYMIREAKKPNPVYEQEPQYHTFRYGEVDAAYIWDTGFQFGEWLEPDIYIFENPNYFNDCRKNSIPSVATAYLRYSSLLLSKMAEVLGNEEDMKFYRDYSQKVAEIYDAYFIKENGCILPGRQAANVQALRFELCSSEKRHQVLQYLLQCIRENGMHLNTGFLSTRFLLPVLSENGYIDMAYQLLEQESAPSWLANVKAGATTILEEWDGYELHRGSFNHYSKGAVCEFLFDVVCGIKTDFDKPGYKHFIVAPQPGGSLSFAEAKLDSPYGRIESRWEKREDEIQYHIVIPPNTTAMIEIWSSGEQKRKELGSGSYDFNYKE